MPGEGGTSSTPRLLGSITDAGVYSDHPLSRVMTGEEGGADRAVISFVVPGEGGASSTPRLLGSITDAGVYWITRFRG